MYMCRLRIYPFINFGCFGFGQCRLREHLVIDNVGVGLCAVVIINGLDTDTPGEELLIAFPVGAVEIGVIAIEVVPRLGINPIVNLGHVKRQVFINRGLEGEQLVVVGKHPESQVAQIGELIALGVNSWQGVIETAEAILLVAVIPRHIGGVGRYNSKCTSSYCQAH